MERDAMRGSVRADGEARQQIVAEISTAGSIAFSRFMELALYHEQDGFFQRTAPGPGGHFITAPHVSRVFIEALARAATKARTAVGDDAQIVDIGAGDGTLLASLARMTGMPAIGIDRSDAARRAIEHAGLAASADIPPDIHGFVICNELFDNLPFDLIDRDTDAEIRIEMRDGMIAATGELARARPLLGDAAREMIETIARSLRRGYAMIIDYCEMDEPIRGYAGHRPVHDVLAAPGESDITGPVDLDAIAAMASASGLQVQARTTQRDLLHALGYRDALDQMKADQTAARIAGDHVTEISLWNARGEAAMLVDPQAMGAYGVLVLATEGLPPLLD